MKKYIIFIFVIITALFLSCNATKKNNKNNLTSTNNSTNPLQDSLIKVGLERIMKEKLSPIHKKKIDSINQQKHIP